MGRDACQPSPPPPPIRGMEQRNKACICIIDLITVPQEFESDPDVLYCRPLAKKGDKVTAVTDGMPTW